MSTRKNINLGIVTLTICAGMLAVGKMNADSRYHPALREAESAFLAACEDPNRDFQVRLGEIVRGLGTQSSPYEIQARFLMEIQGEELKKRFGCPTKPLLSNISDSEAAILLLLVCGGLVCLSAQGAWLIVLYCARSFMQEVRRK